MKLACLAVVSLLALAGCTNPCVALAEKLCECSPDGTGDATDAERDLCKKRVAEDKARIDTTSEQEDLCSSLVDTCDCHKIDTPEGKAACGLAR